MRIVLLRHGPAGERDPLRWPDDRERPLTDKGVTRTRQAVRGLLRLEQSVDAVLTSPLLRAEQTARVLADEGGIEAMETETAL